MAGDGEMRGYAVCTEPRSGSTFLCRILASTGVLGRPMEYFNTPGMRGRGHPDYPEDRDAQVGEILKLGSTPNGIYGLKLFSDQFDAVRHTRWAERLPSLGFISLVRLDALGQSISHVRARQTQQFRHDQAAQGEAVYDFGLINDELVRLMRARARWGYWLAANGMPVLHLEYERLIQAPQETAAAVGRFLGVPEVPPIDLAQATLPQRDAVNDDWRARYVAQARDLGAFH